MNVDGCIGVQFTNPGSRNLVARLSYILWAQEELGGQVCDGDWRRIMEREAFDASQGDILGNLHTQTLEADEQDVGGAHALHSLVAQDIKLTAVEGFVDFSRANNRLVDLHPRDQVNLWEFLVFLHTVTVSQCQANRRVVRGSPAEAAMTEIGPVAFRSNGARRDFLHPWFFCKT